MAEPLPSNALAAAQDKLLKTLVYYRRIKRIKAD
jgi:hypothetical protein